MIHLWKILFIVSACLIFIESTRKRSPIATGHHSPCIRRNFSSPNTCPCPSSQWTRHFSHGPSPMVVSSSSLTAPVTHVAWTDQLATKQQPFNSAWSRYITYTNSNNNKNIKNKNRNKSNITNKNNIPLCIYQVRYNNDNRRRKFRSRTSDKMDRWSSGGGKRPKKVRWEGGRRERVSRKKAEVFLTFWLRNVHAPQRLHFFSISTSTSGPTMKCFNQFYLQMCFAPRLRLRFRHLNFQRCSENEVF